MNARAGGDEWTLSDSLWMCVGGLLGLVVGAILVLRFNRWLVSRYR